MKATNCFMLFIFGVSGLIRHAYGSSIVVPAPAREVGIKVVVKSDGLLKPVPESHTIFVPAPASHRLVVQVPASDVKAKLVSVVPPSYYTAVPMNVVNDVADPKCPNVAAACAEGALDNGYMDARFLIKAVPISKDSSCPCCALCHQEANCLSQAFNTRTRECRLYRAVAGYTTFKRDDKWKYMISGNSNTKSKHEQFCRRDHDCSAAGDACRGRICTNKKTVLCSTIYDVFMRGGKSGNGLGNEIIATYGWIDGKEKRIACMLNHLSPGYTVLFRNKHKFRFNEKSIKSYNTELKDGVVPYSNMHLAERLRKRTRGGRYRLQVYVTAQHSTKPQSWVQLDVPKGQQVIGMKIRPVSTHKVKVRYFGSPKFKARDRPFLSLPYLARPHGLNQGKGKHNKRNGLLSMHKNGAGFWQWDLARTDGGISWAHDRKECALLMHE